MMGFIPKMVTIRIAKFMLGLGGGFFSRYFGTLEGRIQFLHLATIQHSSFASAKPSCELRGPAVDPTEKNTF